MNIDEELASEKLVKALVVEEKLIPDDIVRSEVNFLVLPFFALWDKDVKSRTKTEYKAMIKRIITTSLPRSCRKGHSNTNGYAAHKYDP